MYPCLYFHAVVSDVCISIIVSEESEEFGGFRMDWIGWKWGIDL